MDSATVELAESLVTPRYIDSGAESLRHFQRVLRSLVAQRRCPEEGLPECVIEQLMHQLATMDSNNFAHHIGGGEREGRVVCALVRRRHYNLTHGIGRSGDLTADQPKAAGSSLLYQLTNRLALDLLHLAGAPSTQAALVVPMATGMTLALALRCVAKRRVAEDARKAEEGKPNLAEHVTHADGEPPMAPRYVLWCRVDQKTALKCIDAAGFLAFPVELDQAPRRSQRTASARKTTHKKQKDDDDGEAASANEHDADDEHPFFIASRVERLQEAMDKLGGRAQVLCVLSTTSCFAPRLPDDTLAIARFCRAHNIAHVVNNAYGVQSRVIMTRLDAAQRHGRVDFVVQSGDKNFLVPVGGAVLSSSSKASLAAAAALYAGRASATPAIDLFVTFLSLGRQGMLQLWRDRYVVRAHLEQQMRDFAEARGEVFLCEMDRVPCAGDDEVGGEMNEKKEKGDGSSAALPDTKSLPRNDISFAVTMRHYCGTHTTVADAEERSSSEQFADAKAFGAKLFRSAVTGPRVVCPAPNTTTTIAGCAFRSYGVHQDAPPYACPLLVVACGIGMTRREVDMLIRKLVKLWPARFPTR